MLECKLDEQEQNTSHEKTEPDTSNRSILAEGEQGLVVGMICDQIVHGLLKPQSDPYDAVPDGLLRIGIVGWTVTGRAGQGREDRRSEVSGLDSAEVYLDLFVSFGDAQVLGQWLLKNAQTSKSSIR